jgi:hypothetical protein
VNISKIGVLTTMAVSSTASKDIMLFSTCFEEHNAPILRGETSVNFSQTTQHNIPDDITLNIALL